MKRQHPVAHKDYAHLNGPTSEPDYGRLRPYNVIEINLGVDPKTRVLVKGMLANHPNQALRHSLTPVQYEDYQSQPCTQVHNGNGTAFYEYGTREVLYVVTAH